MSSNRGRPPGRDFTARVNVPLLPEQLARYREAAEALGVALAEWIRQACDEAESEQRMQKGTR